MFDSLLLCRYSLLNGNINNNNNNKNNNNHRNISNKNIHSIWELIEFIFQWRNASTYAVHVNIFSDKQKTSAVV